MRQLNGPQRPIKQRHEEIQEKANEQPTKLARWQVPISWAAVFLFWRAAHQMGSVLVSSHSLLRFAAAYGIGCYLCLC